MSESTIKISELSQEAVFEVPRRINWQKAFMSGNCQLIVPNPKCLNEDELETIYDSGFSDSDESIAKYFQENSDQLQPTSSYCYLLPNLKSSAKNAQAILFNASSICAVVCLHGETVMGLVGGGMDHSWDICSAYVRLGYLPPFHFCSVPNIESLKSDVVRSACMRTCELFSQGGVYSIF